MEAEHVGKKRRRVGGNGAGAAVLACTQCNRRHTKCDGKLPCATCASSGLECQFPSTVKKRGPQPGEKKQLEKLVATLGEELAALRDQRDFWQHRAQFLENLMVSLPDPGVDVDLDSALALAVAPLASAPLPAESGLAFCVDVSAFLQAYEKTAAPLLGMHAPPIDRHSFARLEPCGANLQLLTMICTGARALGQAHVADEFFQQAISMSNSLLSANSHEVASALNLMSLLFVVGGVEHDALFYANSAVRMLDAVSATTDSESPIHLVLRQQRVLSRITYAEGHVSDMALQHDLFSTLLNELGNPGGSDPTIPFHALAILGKTRAWIAVNTATLSTPQLLAQLAGQLALLQRAENQYLAALRASPLASDAPFNARLRAFIGCMRAALYASAGLAEIAVGMADSLLCDLRGTPEQPALIGIDSIFAATSLAEAMLKSSRMIEFEECCSLLSHYATGFPIAAVIVQQLKYAANPSSVAAAAASGAAVSIPPRQSPASTSDHLSPATSDHFSPATSDSLHLFADQDSVVAELSGLLDSMDESPGQDSLSDQALFDIT